MNCFNLIESVAFAFVYNVGNLCFCIYKGPTSIDDVDPKYLIPLFDRIFCCLPGSCRKVLRCNLEFQNPGVGTVRSSISKHILVHVISALLV